MRQKINRIPPLFKYVSLFCLLLALLTACTTTSSKVVYKDFVIVKAKPEDNLSSLAGKYLNDISKGWLIAEFNGISGVKTGEKLIIPLKPFDIGRLRTYGLQSVPILTYHRFSKENSSKMVVTEDSFDAQMKYLKENGYHVITLDQLLDFLNLNYQTQKKSVVITIDDGWRSCYEIAFPILKKYGFPATLFIYTDFIGGKKAMSWEQVKEMSENGFDIQCHSKTHRNLAKMYGDETLNDYVKVLDQEVALSTKRIKQKLGKECKYFAYPFGQTTTMLIEVLKKHGYHGAFTITRGSNPFFINNFVLKRSVIYGGFSLSEFKKNLIIFTESDLK
ncbi:MAG: polysaccharide deacetylase family protein [Thermodesulfobacteriota bacterium]|nr:polysaccharide deacetylase family protein [Thermodesulfobacteriota bacterium]